MDYVKAIKEFESFNAQLIDIHDHGGPSVDKPDKYYQGCELLIINFYQGDKAKLLTTQLHTIQAKHSRLNLTTNLMEIIEFGERVIKDLELNYEKEQKRITDSAPQTTATVDKDDTIRNQATEISYLNDDYDRIKRLLAAEKKKYLDDFQLFEKREKKLTTYKVAAVVMAVLLFTHINFIVSVGVLQSWLVAFLSELGIIVTFYTMWVKEVPAKTQFAVGVLIGILAIVIDILKESKKI
ncbi:MAG TPA: hypothetical protein VIU12_16235 [Chryseolinea sp.]